MWRRKKGRNKRQKLLKEMCKGFTISVILFLGIELNSYSATYKQVAVEHLYLRAGPNKNFEILKRLKKGDILESVGNKYGWTQVILPSDVGVYVYRDLISIDVFQAIVVKNRVNLRAKPSLNSTILSQVNKGDILKVVEVKSDWVKVQPPPDLTGWVKSEYLKEYEFKPVVEIPEEEKPPVSEKEKTEKEKTEKEEEQQAISNEPKINYQFFRGVIADVGRIWGRKSKYKLITTEGIYYLKGPNQLILSHMGEEVTIEGEKVDEDVIYIHRIIDEDN